MATRDQWIKGARPLTLPAAIAPVLLGTAIAKFEGSFRPAIALLALIVGLALQVGVNYANDFSDGIRGTDNDRVGPVRLVGQKLAEPEEVKRAAFISFTVAAAAGLVMTLITGLWLLIPIGALSIVAAWFYTGGKRPYGYSGFGELFVFVFFGLVAVIGTTYAQTGILSWIAIFIGISCGALSSAILIANNLRDIETDAVSGKKTLAVKLGDAKTRELYRLMIVIAFAMPIIVWFQETGPMYAYVGLFAIISARYPLHIVRTDAKGNELIAVIEFTGRLLLIFAVISSIAIWFS
jgi:1,4-dihydroxy-2-naphthoate octaprenyltransferase